MSRILVAMLLLFAVGCEGGNKATAPKNPTPVRGAEAPPPKGTQAPPIPPLN